MNRLREYWRAFFQGMTRPSLPALVGMLIVAVLGLFACMTLITPELFSGAGYGIFVDDSIDEYSFLSADILRLRGNPPTDPVLLYFGTSALREALSSRGHLEDLLQEHLGRKIKVLNLSAGGLSHWEIAAMFDGVKDLTHGIVVLPCSPTLLVDSADRLYGFTRKPRLALRSPFLEEERRLQGIELRGPGTGNFFRDNFDFFVVRLVPVFKHALLGRKWRNFHAADKWRDPNEAELLRFIKLRGRWVEQLPGNGDLNAEAFGRLLDLVRANPNLHIVLLEPVSNPKTSDYVKALPGYDEAQAQYEEYLQGFLAGDRTHYRNFEEALALAPEDFKDTVHFRNPQARVRFTELLAVNMAAILAANPELMEAP